MLTKIWDWFLWILPLYSDNISMDGVMSRRTWKEWRQIREDQRKGVTK